MSRVMTAGQRLFEAADWNFDTLRRILGVVWTLRACYYNRLVAVDGEA
jgi:hypothetical protein